MTRLALDRQWWMRTALSMAALSGWCLAPAASAGGPGHARTSHAHMQRQVTPVGLWEGYQGSCQQCRSDWSDYGAARCDCRSPRPRLILGLLDSVACGVEQVLGLSGRASAGCDAVACDDACDAMTLQQLQLPPGSQPVLASPVPQPPEVIEESLPRPRSFSPADAQDRVINPVPAPRSPQSTDPFADEPTSRRRINPAISPSAYFE